MIKTKGYKIYSRLELVKGQLKQKKSWAVSTTCKHQLLADNIAGVTVLLLSELHFYIVYTAHDYQYKRRTVYTW